MDSSTTDVMKMKIRELTTTNALTQLERIGQGRCGTVWAIRCSACDDHSHLAMKREDGSTGRSISHEYLIHQKIAKASLRCNFASFAIPRSVEFLDAEDNTTWSGILSRLPSGYTTCNAIISEKIISVKASARRLLVQKFRPDINAEEIMRSQSNEHCLIRPYLGRRRYRQIETETSAGESRRRLRALSLRNYPLHMDQMEQLGIDPSGYAMAMADALAFLHWVADVDGNDVEFVLAQPRLQSDMSSSIETGGVYSDNTAILGPHMMWILDFDLCRDISLDEEGVKQANKAFWGNDPYFPRPGSGNTGDQRLWGIFQHRYLESSAAALHEEPDCVKRLPGLLIDEIKRTLALSSA